MKWEVGNWEMGKWGDSRISTNTPKPSNPNSLKPQLSTPNPTNKLFQQTLNICKLFRLSYLSVVSKSLLLRFGGFLGGVIVVGFWFLSFKSRDKSRQNFKKLIKGRLIDFTRQEQ